MKVEAYVGNLIKKLGLEKAEQSLKDAISNHQIIYKAYGSPKSVTTIKFFQKALLKTQNQSRLHK